MLQVLLPVLQAIEDADAEIEADQNARVQRSWDPKLKNLEARINAADQRIITLLGERLHAQASQPRGRST